MVERTSTLLVHQVINSSLFISDVATSIRTFPNMHVSMYVACRVQCKESKVGISCWLFLIGHVILCMYEACPLPRL